MGDAFVDPLANIVENPTQAPLPNRTQDVKAIIIHTTGSGSTWQQIVNLYTAADGVGPHYAIQLDGTIHRFAAETRVAWHAGLSTRERQLYEQGYGVWSHWHWGLSDATAVDTGSEYAGYKTWKDMWRVAGKESPLDLPTGSHPNNVTIGIECQQPGDADITADIFTDAQYTSLIALVADIVRRYSLPLDRLSLMGHYDVSPMRRSTTRGGWDPGDAFNWDRLFNGVQPPPPGE
jgi:N-acetyl-anhydromuramyl-L-alanine amidase AmpD